ncbi:IPT/TIG domain-containing protein [Flavobacterium sp. ZE23DGlu08]|uniref:IPT/TIG domain-containing protein n=1 Tax=Flavobacterium sp. ZE23DGlu08 TaxID=3059026 RepID=UPI00265F2DCB|nr:IPT/TIG domain-containing protein [Flavobacterium sp. ZE23DGlu08]WKL43722.1 hypothetical protein Q1W72_15405 [Flavobacterium sp. ZE23DGlu08]
MKKLKIKYLLSFLMIASIFSVLSSCSNDDNNGSASSVLAIESVSKSEAGDLVATDFGFANNVYIIKGSGFSSVQKIYFNDTDTYFNPTLVTDTAIFVTIDINTPYANASNELKIVTKTGSITYPFVVAPPAPVLLYGFTPINAAEGDVVTIYGNFFLEPVVTFGTTATPVISSSLTEIKVKVPANSNSKYVTVTTISGSATSTSAVGSALYDDALQGDTGHWMWNGADTFDTNFTSDKAQGLKSIKFIFGGWNGADMKFASRDVSKYKAFRVRVKSISTNADASIKFVFGGWAYQITKPFSTDWTYIEIPFSEIGNPTTFDQLTLQESGGFGGNTILMDDMGFVLK